jgi:3',5'-cyclic AMP phosphodiesterase CpdA
MDRQFKEKWSDVFLRYRSLRVPWQVCLGNHDYEGDPTAQISFTNGARNPGSLWQCPAENYKFTHPLPGGGHAEFFALDTNGCQEGVRNAYPHSLCDLQTQVTELGEKLSSSEATWKIVFGHHPMYNKGARHSIEGHLLREGCHLEETLTSNGAIAYFCGHEHVFQHHRSMGIDHFGCGASGAEYSGFYGGRCEDNTCPGWVDEKDNIGFVEVSLNTTSMYVSFISADESVIHTIHRPLVAEEEELHLNALLGDEVLDRSCVDIANQSLRC